MEEVRPPRWIGWPLEAAGDMGYPCFRRTRLTRARICARAFSRTCQSIVTLDAGVAASLLPGPGAVRAFVRRRRRSAGLCVRCRYPLAGLPRCPECGTDQAA